VNFPPIKGLNTFNTRFSPQRRGNSSSQRRFWTSGKSRFLLAENRRYAVFFVPNAANHDAFANRMDSAFKTVGIEYVPTQESAAQRYAPFLFSSRVSCRIASSHNIEDVLGAREVSEGSHFSKDGPFMFKKRHDPTWLANPVQVYLDLQLAGGRTAEHLRMERIGF